MQKIKRNPLDFINKETVKKGNVREGFTKATFQVQDEYLFKLQKLPFDIREKTGKKPSQIDLVNEALELLLEKYAPLIK